MKKRIAAFMAMLLMLSMLPTPAHAFYVDMVSYTADPFTGETTGMTLYVENESGDYDQISVYDENGNQLYIQTGENEWEKLDTPISSQEVAQQKAAEKAAEEAALVKKKAEMEKTYHITIANDFTQHTAGLEDLETQIKIIPAALYEKTTAQLTKMGKKLRIANMITNNAHLMSGYAGYYTPAKVQIELSPYAAIYAFPHEYGHMIFMTLLPQIYSSSTLQKEWTALTGGEGPTHVSAYAMTAYQEDLAETFDSLVSGFCEDYGDVKSLAMQYPNCLAIKKIDYMRQLLCKVYGLDRSVFPNLTPSVPSSWAQKEVDAYQNLLGGSHESVVPYKGNAHATGYQTPATRVQFVYSISEDLISHLFSAGFFRNMRYADYEKQWLPSPRNADGSLSIPFTDVRQSNLSFTAICAIHAMHLQGVINGKNATTFDPNGQITRQEAAAILYRLCQALGYKLPKGTGTFADADKIAPWAQEAVSAVSAAGIMSGVGNNRFDPTGIYTCEQSALCLLRTYNLLTK